MTTDHDETLRLARLIVSEDLSVGDAMFHGKKVAAALIALHADNERLRTDLRCSEIQVIARGNSFAELKAENERLRAEMAGIREVSDPDGEMPELSTRDQVMHHGERSALLTSVTRLVDKARAERDAYRAMLCDVIASASPNKRDHPSMSAQWERANELLRTGVR